MRLRSACLVLVALAGAARAGDHPTQDDVLAAVRRGELRPLADIERNLAGRLQGDVIKVEIERKRGVWIYEFKTLDAGGRRADVYVDGRSGDIVRIERK